MLTSRPTTIAEDWLEGLWFAASELQPMSTTDGASARSARGRRTYDRIMTDT